VPLSISILDLCPIIEGGDARLALLQSRDLARHAERLGYKRFWLAEHHNIPGVASAATSVCIGFIAEGTRTIRVGAGGVMLPNHAPLLIAEQFGTLDALYQGRIDLGIGRAPGGDMATARALRRSLPRNEGEDRFPYDLAELQTYFEPDEVQQVNAVPGAGANVPIWILGSSLYGAEIAAYFGLPFAFASHFAPAEINRATATYRAKYKPSEQNPAPRVMLAANVIAAPTDEEAEFLASSLKQAFVNLRFGRPGKLPPPIADFDEGLDDAQRAMLDHVLSCSVVGGPAKLKREMAAFIATYEPDELILAGQIFDHEKRLRSFELAAECAQEI
jgi:luciferase family oxidoreductase group 1